MLMAIDIGNTHVKIGVWHMNAWRHIWRARTVSTKTADDYGLLLRDFLSSVANAPISAIAISSVVPVLTHEFVTLTRHYFQLEPLVVTSQVPTGIKIALDQPQQVGSDRLANVAAAWALYGGPALVVDLGTATKFEAVSADGVYHGGAIAPGMRVAFDALPERIALLEQVALSPPPQPIGRTTGHAVQSGIFWGYVALIEGMVARTKQAMTEDHIRVVATGGLAPLLQAHTTVLDQLAPELTLDGLRIIYALNHR
jgi:type III pantothenate kinase